MAGTQGAIKAGRSFVELFADDSKLIAGLKRANAGLKSFGKDVAAAATKLAALGAAGAVGLGAAVMRFADAGSALKDMSDRTGVSVETLSELKYAAEQSGTSIEVLEKGLTKLAKSGAADPVAAFRELANQIQATADPAERTRIALENFGRAGTELLPLMLNGAEGIAALEEEARKLGVTMSTEDAASAEEFGDKIAALQTALDALAIKAGSVLVPALTQVVEKLTETASAMGKLKKDADEAADGMGTVWMNVGNTLERWGKTVGDVFHDARTEFAATSEKLDNMLKNQADLNDEVDRQANAEIGARAAERAALEKEHERQHDQAILDLAKQQADEKERAAQAARDKAAADKAAAAAAAEEAAFLETGLAAAAGAGTGAVAAQEAELDELVDDALDPFGSFAQELMMQAGGPPAPTELAAMAAPVATAAGTFAAAGAAGLGVSTAQERAADAAESTAEYTRQLVEMGRNGPFVFQA
jgi:hypothetical protein